MSWLDAPMRDVRYAWRSLARTPGFAVMVVLTMALGVGVNTSTFTLLDRLYLRPPSGVENAESLRRLWFIGSGVRSQDGQPRPQRGGTYAMYRAIADASGDPRTVGLYVPGSTVRIGDGDARRTAEAVVTTASYFSVLGVRATLGRVYTPAEDSVGQGSRVVVVAHDFWREALNADRTILGRTIRVNGERYTVIGVLPPDFTGLDLQAADLWFPLAAIPASHWIARGAGQAPWTGSDLAAFQMIHRVPALADAAFDERATHAVRDVNRRTQRTMKDTLMRVVTGSIISARGPGKPSQATTISTRLAAVGAIIFLIAIANVINLLLARAARRRREIAVRMALGISRSRLVRLLTAETMLLALLGGAAAVLAAWWGGSLLRTLVLPDIVWREPVLHWRVTALALGTALSAGLVAGLAPAMGARRPDLTRALREGATDGSVHRSRLRNALVIVQAALSVLLLVGAALFIRSLGNVEALRLGYDTERLLFASMETSGDSSAPRAVVDAKMEDVRQRLAGHPRVESVARSWFTPMSAFAYLPFYWDADSSGSLAANLPTYAAVSSTYFATVGTRVVRGTTFDDRMGGPLQIVVNEAMASLVWPGRDPIGRCIRFERREGACYTVIGVAENARQLALIEPEPKPQFYLPLGRGPEGSSDAGMLVVRAHRDALSQVASVVSRELRRAFPQGEITVVPMTEAIEGQYRPWRLGASLFTALGVLALTVALIGIYSTVSYGVSQRTHEFGVRVALGASVRDVLTLVVSGGLKVVAPGIALGIALALASGKVIAALLYGVTPGDPGVILLVAALILVVAAVATLVPAWRASRVDPVEALRAE